MRLNVCWLALLLLMVGWVAGGVACRRGQTGDAGPAVVRVELSPVEGDSLVVGTPVRVTVTLERNDGSPVEGAKVSLEATMTHAGMQPVFAEATEVAPGMYQARVEFTMGGDWIIIVRGTLPDGKPFEHMTQVPGVRAK